MGKRLVSLICFLGVILLGSCSTASGTPVIVATAQSQGITSTPSSVPVISVPELSTPTLIAQPSATQEMVIATPPSTLGQTYEECSQAWDSNELGEWALCDPLADPITLIDTSGEIRQFSYKDFYGQEVTNPCTRLQHITEDARYLYFSLEDDCIMTEPGFIPSIGLFRMDLTDGKVSETLPAFYDFATYLGNTYSLSISPTGRRMAYILHKDPPLSLNILDLQTGQNSSYQLDENYMDGGSFTWSQDGTKLVFMLVSEDNYDHFISMEYLDLSKADSLVTFVKDQMFEWIVSSVEITPTGIKISPPGEDPLFYEFETKILSPVK